MNSPDTSAKPSAEPSQNKAIEHVADAHHLLKALQRQLGQHPELEEAIAKLELALSALTLQTGGLL
jgi:Lon protease-like protein